MNIERTAVNEFWVGHGGADAVARPLVRREYAPEKVYKGVRVRAATGNTAVVYVGPAGVTVDSGYPLPAGKEVEVENLVPDQVVLLTPRAGPIEGEPKMVAIFCGFFHHVTQLVLGPPSGAPREVICPWKTYPIVVLSLLVIAIGFWFPAPLYQLVDGAAHILAVPQ